MTELRRRSPENGHGGPRLPGLSLAALLLLGACNATSQSPPLSETPAAEGSMAPSSGASDGSAQVGQTETSWGRIWDDVPEAFPMFPGAVPAGGTSEAVSAALAIEGVEARDVVSWMQMQLERTTFTTEGLNGPLEDGGYILDSFGQAGCRIQVKAAPMGSLVSLIVRYGADCPAP